MLKTTLWEHDTVLEPNMFPCKFHFLVLVAVWLLSPSQRVTALYMPACATHH
jgi:hypothetical protein